MLVTYQTIPGFWGSRATKGWVGVGDGPQAQKKSPITEGSAGFEPRGGRDIFFLRIWPKSRLGFLFFLSPFQGLYSKTRDSKTRNLL